MACLILTSRLSGLKRTHYWIRDDEKVGYLGLIFFLLDREFFDFHDIFKLGVNNFRFFSKLLYLNSGFSGKTCNFM